MYSITSRRWFFPAVFVIALLVEIFVLRTSLQVDTQRDSKLRKLQVRSGYELLLDQQASQTAQPILSYSGTPRHNHRLTLDIRNARLSDESLRLLAMLHPPKISGRLIYAPDPSDTTGSGSGCLAGFRVEFPAAARAEARSVEIAPPTSADVLNSSETRLVHLTSTSPLAIRVSSNSPDGARGPGCRNLLSIGSWQQVVGKDVELAFLADPASLINLTLSSNAIHSANHEVDSLELEHLLPARLATRPFGLARVIQSRRRAGTPPLTVTGLRLGDDFFDVELAGNAGIPIPEILGWTKWPILVLLDVPLLACAIAVFFLKKTVFISYSWADRDRVLPIYERLKKAGLPVWIDREQLRGGADWEERIRREMLKCRRVVIFLSHSLNDGGFLLAELGLARAIAKDRLKRRTFLIPVRLENCSIPPILAQWNAIDLFEPDGEARLFEDLGVKRPSVAHAEPRTVESEA